MSWREQAGTHKAVQRTRLPKNNAGLRLGTPRPHRPRRLMQSMATDARKLGAA